jgi:hypothetical protein
VLDRRLEPDVGLAHAHANAAERKAAHQLVCEGVRERLEQLERALVHLAHAGDDLAVVDRVLDPVAESAFADVEPDVVEEALPVAALVLVNAVEALQLEPDQLDGRQSAAATVSASTCSRTSWTRRIVAPRS